MGKCACAAGRRGRWRKVLIRGGRIRRRPVERIGRVKCGQSKKKKYEELGGGARW